MRGAPPAVIRRTLRPLSLRFWEDRRGRSNSGQRITPESFWRHNAVFTQWRAYMATDAKTVARRWFEDVWDKRQDALIDELMAPESIGHLEDRDAGGPDDFRKNYNALLGAMPDMRVFVEDLVGEGDRAAV